MKHSKEICKKIKTIYARAKKELNYWLSYAGVSSTEEFFLRKNCIKKSSYHKYYDTLDHINYIRKLENVMKICEKKKDF